MSTLLGQSITLESSRIQPSFPVLQVSRYFLNKANHGAKDNLDVMASNICGAAASVLTASCQRQTTAVVLGKATVFIEPHVKF